MDLNEINEQQLNDSYQELLKAKEAALIVELDRKEAELKIKEDICQKKQYYKKDGTTLDTGKVKLPTFKKAMEVHLNQGPNKVAEELDLLEEYISDMKNDSQILSNAKSLQDKMIQEKEVKGEAKDVKEELKTHLDEEVVEALNILVDFEIKNKKEAMEEDTGKSSKKKKDQSEILALVKQIKDKLGLI